MFLTANSRCLVASNEEAYGFAKSTASHNERGKSAQDALVDVVAFLEENTVTFEDLWEFTEESTEARAVYELAVKARGWIRTHALNELGR